MKILSKNKLFKTFKLENVDFISTGMNVNSMGDQFELLKLVTLNPRYNTREIYIIGFIQYQLPKWRKILGIQDKIVFYDKAFDSFMKQKKSFDRRPSRVEAYQSKLSKISQGKETAGFSDIYNQNADLPETNNEYFSPETKRKVEKLMKIRDEVVDEEEMADNSFKNDTNLSSFVNQSSVEDKEIQNNLSGNENDIFFSLTRAEKDSGATFGQTKLI